MATLADIIGEVDARQVSGRTSSYNAPPPVGNNRLDNAVRDIQEAFERDLGRPISREEVIRDHLSGGRHYESPNVNAAVDAIRNSPEARNRRMRPPDPEPPVYSPPPPREVDPDPPRTEELYPSRPTYEPPPATDTPAPPSRIGTVRQALESVQAPPAPDPIRPYTETYTPELFEEEFERPSYEDFSKSPGFRFMLEEGLEAIERTASASGNLRTTGTLQDLQKRAAALASTGYNEYYDQEAGAYGLNRGTHFMNEGERAGAAGFNRGTHVQNEQNRFASETRNRESDIGFLERQQEFDRGNYEYDAEYGWRKGRAKTSDIMTLAQLGVPRGGTS